MDASLDGALEEAANIIAESSSISVFTGAGISVESGIPDFRSPGGLWSRYDPFTYCNYEVFKERPELFWCMARALVLDVHERLGGDPAEAIKTGEFRTATPNPAHKALAELEDLGIVSTVITQNIDGLHQLAGSKKVIEIHGTDRTCTCTACFERFPMSEAVRQWVAFAAARAGANAAAASAAVDESDGFVPRHAACGGAPLKSDVTMFGEALPAGALGRAAAAVLGSPACLVVGTSLEVAPANTVPGLVRVRAGRLIICNLDGSGAGRADVALRGPAGEVLPRLARRVRELRAAGRGPRGCVAM